MSDNTRSSRWQPYQRLENPIPEESFDNTHHGLGIDAPGATSAGVSPPTPAPPTFSRRDTGGSISRVPVGGKSPPGSADPLLSPSTAPGTPGLTPGLTPGRASGSTAYDPGAYFAGEDYARDGLYAAAGTGQRRYADTDPLKRRSMAAGSMMSQRSVYENEFNPHECPTHKDFHQGRANWLAISILCLALFSTVFSGIFVGIALAAPRWGRTIRKGGALTASSAYVLTNIFAKLIELSFVTVFVTFLGQVLSRRAFSKDSKGVNLAEFSMRNWVMQPGSMVTHYESVQYAALTALGVLSLASTVLAMLYTTASGALVAPYLKFGGWEHKPLVGLVTTSFANPIYLQKTCKTPIGVSGWDPDFTEQLVGTTCLEIEHAAQGYHNYVKYMSHWADLKSAGNSTTEQRYRPPGFALFNENVTVNASWIEIHDVAATSAKFGGRIINNVTLAMPHVGVVAAAQDPKNNILQPQDLDGQGIYELHAGVPSPYLNVLCANVAKSELAPLVYETQPNVTLNSTRDFSELSTHWMGEMNWSNWTQRRTPLHDVFGWDETNLAPGFYKFPIKFNTVLNATGAWGRESVYLLGLGANEVAAPKNQSYVVCGVRAGTTPHCSTRFAAMGAGGEMSAHCEDPGDEMAFIHGNSSRTVAPSKDWFNVGITTMMSMSLNTGVTDGAASNSRLLTQLILKEPRLDPGLPSIAEALGVMVGCSLLMASEGAPFVEFWNYSANNNILSPGQYQTFNASIRAQQYASGGVLPYQRGFHLVLMLVFLTNIFVLCYLFANKGLVTDFSEPPNLFSIAVNSPPNRLLAGSCGGGPEAHQYKVNWAVEMEGSHLYMTDKSGGLEAGYSAPSTGRVNEGGVEFEMESPTTPRTPVTPGGTAGGVRRSGTRIGKAYEMLAKRRSFL
ncbi:hypothetical protein EJ06DRAFT_1351 [Trichodelitschia bisporula]|uniref:Uncharacterized protein n=1 Tax=Trichodelitschia bisporula TaxID=703511 RepID=A0A6G1I9A6_9PEZI|nr:hypothetical protein EJ06DRAFT_1351 [Trichodelitschia bisporula]